MINQHSRVFLFPQAFSDKIGDKICKSCKIDVEDLSTTIRVWNDLKKEALRVSIKDNSQISRLRKFKKVEESELPRPARPDRLEKPVVLEHSTESRIRGHIIKRRKPEDLDTVTQLMKELRLRQVEAETRLNEQILFMRDIVTKTVAAIPQPVYVAPNQYGNRECLPLQGGYETNLKGGYWDRKPHGRDSCEEQQRAINREEVHRKRKVLYLGQEGVGDFIRVPVPVEIDGKVTWQQEWVRGQLWKKESDMLRANCMTFEKDQNDQENKCELIREEINRVPVVFLAIEEANVEEKRGRPIEDVGEK